MKSILTVAVTLPLIPLRPGISLEPLHHPVRLTIFGVVIPKMPSGKLAAPRTVGVPDRPDKPLVA
jgi:hypothetical protein